MRKRIFFLWLVMICGLSTISHAGVVITNTDGSIMMIQDGKMRQSGGKQQEGGIILDPDRGVMIIVNDMDRTYIQTTPEEFCGTVKAKMDEIMETIPPEQRKMMEEMGMGRQRKDTVRVKVVEAGPGGNIAGYSTVKYDVYKNGQLFQELWIADSTPVKKEIRNMKKTMEFFKEAEECISDMGGGGSSLSSSKEYQKLYDKGWVMKSITHYSGLPFGGQRTEKMEVRSIEVKDIPASEFQPPKGYKRVSVSDMYKMHE